MKTAQRKQLNEYINKAELQVCQLFARHYQCDVSGSPALWSRGHLPLTMTTMDFSHRHCTRPLAPSPVI